MAINKAYNDIHKINEAAATLVEELERYKAHIEHDISYEDYLEIAARVAGYLAAGWDEDAAYSQVGDDIEQENDLLNDTLRGLYRDHNEVCGLIETIKQLTI